MFSCFVHWVKRKRLRINLRKKWTLEVEMLTFYHLSEMSWKPFPQDKYFIISFSFAPPPPPALMKCLQLCFCLLISIYILKPISSPLFKRYLLLWTKRLKIFIARYKMLNGAKYIEGEVNELEPLNTPSCVCF